MNGRIQIQERSLVGRISGSGSLKGCIKSSCNLTGRVAISVGYDDYSGPYVVDPDFVPKVLKTKDRVMSDDVSINEIRVDKTPNESGGYTVYIG